MKTDRYYTALTIVLVLMLALALKATAATATNSANSELAEMVNPTEAKLTINAEFLFEEEAYIEDIPFDTKAICSVLNFQKAAGVEFDFADEAYFDDIPFKTYSITQVYFQSRFALSE